jgi:hypothetical protein
MSSYSLNVVDNGSGVFTATLLRSPTTAASGGTTITLPVLENVDGSYGAGTTKHLDDAFMKAMRSALNDRAAGN